MRIPVDRARAGAAAMAQAASEYVSTCLPGLVAAEGQSVCRELANAVATVLSLDTDHIVCEDVVIREAIEHRVKWDWIICTNVRKCTLAMFRAWVLNTNIEGESDVP